MEDNKVQITVTYDAAKLVKRLPDIISKYMQNYGKGTEKGSKKAIDDGLKPLAPWTIKVGRPLKGITGTKPLFATGNLYNSIKATSDGQYGGLQMLKYGLKHQKGYPNEWKGFRKVPARPFIGIEDKKRVQAFNEFFKNFRKAFRKWVI